MTPIVPFYLAPFTTPEDPMNTDARNCIANFKVAAAERDELITAAARDGKTLSAFLRDAALAAAGLRAA